MLDYNDTRGRFTAVMFTDVDNHATNSLTELTRAVYFNVIFFNQYIKVNVNDK